MPSGETQSVPLNRLEMVVAGVAKASQILGMGLKVRIDVDGRGRRLPEKLRFRKVGRPSNGAKDGRIDIETLVRMMKSPSFSSRQAALKFGVTPSAVNQRIAALKRKGEEDER